MHVQGCRTRLSRRHSAAVACAFALIAVLLVVALGTPRRAAANGVPERVSLAYLPGVSNWGPSDATGNAEFSYAEAIINLNVSGLPPLNGESYVLWLVDSSSQQSLKAAAFNTTTGGTATYQGTISGLSSYTYDLLLVTVESSAAAGGGPSARKSIGGHFEAVQKPPSTPRSFTDTRPAAGGGVPDTLPLTGEAAPVGSHNANLITGRRVAAWSLIVGGCVLLWASVRHWRVRT